MNALKVHKKLFNPKCTHEIYFTIFPRPLESSMILFVITFESLQEVL